MSWIDRQFAAFGAQLACHENERALSYFDFVAEVDRLEGLIEPLLSGPPAVIAVQMKSTFEALAAMIAIARCKQIALPLSPEMPVVEQAKLLRIAGASFALSTHALSELKGAVPTSKLMDQLIARGHAGLILFSSGTTGEPKGMLHDLDALLARYREVRPRADRTIQLLLADHIGGLDSAFRTLFAGSTLVVPAAPFC